MGKIRIIKYIYRVYNGSSDESQQARKFLKILLKIQLENCKS